MQIKSTFPRSRSQFSNFRPSRNSYLHENLSFPVSELGPTPLVLYYFCGTSLYKAMDRVDDRDPGGICHPGRRRRTSITQVAVDQSECAPAASGTGREPHASGGNDI